jgi:hypothetical protein
MKMTAPAQFRNLDVVLRSSSNLSALVEYLDERVFVISDQEYEGQFILVLELAEQVQEAQLCTQQFLTIIDALPDAAMDV